MSFWSTTQRMRPRSARPGGKGTIALIYVSSPEMHTIDRSIAMNENYLIFPVLFKVVSTDPNNKIGA